MMVDICEVEEMMMMMTMRRRQRTYCSHIDRHIGPHLDRTVGCGPHSPVEDHDIRHSLKRDTGLWLLLLLLDTMIYRCGCNC